MEADILLKKFNPLIPRKEFVVLLTFNSSTPSRKDMREAIKLKLSANPDLMVLKKVIPLHGRKAVKVIVHLYQEEETMRRVEPLYVLKRNGLLEKKQEEKKEGAKEEQKQGEEKKEESKANQESKA